MVGGGGGGRRLNRFADGRPRSWFIKQTLSCSVHVEDFQLLVTYPRNKSVLQTNVQKFISQDSLSAQDSKQDLISYKKYTKQVVICYFFLLAKHF